MTVMLHPPPGIGRMETQGPANKEHQEKLQKLREMVRNAFVSPILLPATCLDL